MKAEFELSVNDDGIPEIIFKHHDRNGSLEQKTLERFVRLAIEHGLEIQNPNGFLEAGTANSYEQYVIRPQINISKKCKKEKGKP